MVLSELWVFDFYQCFSFKRKINISAELNLTVYLNMRKNYNIYCNYSVNYFTVYYMPYFFQHRPEVFNDIIFCESTPLGGKVKKYGGKIILYQRRLLDRYDENRVANMNLAGE